MKSWKLTLRVTVSEDGEYDGQTEIAASRKADVREGEERLLRAGIKILEKLLAARTLPETAP